MAQTDYIVRAGVGFDIDRKSGAQAISTMDNIVGQMQNAATKRTAKGFQDRAKEYNKTIKEVATANKKADQEPNIEFAFQKTEVVLLMVRGKILITNRLQLLVFV